MLPSTLRSTTSTCVCVAVAVDVAMPVRVAHALPSLSLSLRAHISHPLTLSQSPNSSLLTHTQAVKLPNQKLRLTQMDMGRSYYRQVQRIRMRRSIGLLSIGSATRGIAPAALAAMRGALLGNNERAERGAAASTMALINAFAGKPLIANWKMECFANAKRLGKGKFGTVYLSKERRTGIILALKRLTKAQLVKYKVEKQLRREVEIHARMSHPNVLRMFDHFFDADYIYIMLEFAPGGEMYDKLEHAKNQRFSEAKAACYTRDVAAGLDYIHSLDVIHRDLKPENLLLTRDDTVQIADFGWSVHTPSGRSKTLCGTLDYLAPEMALKQPHDKNLDTWTLGILCYEFIHGQPPFEEETQKETMKRIKNVDLKFPKYLPRHTSVEVKLTDGARELINLFLKRDPADRLPLSEVPRNPWIHEHCSLGYE